MSLRPVAAVGLVLQIAACDSHPKVDWAGGDPRAPSLTAGVTLAPDHESVQVSWTANAADEGVSSFVVYSAAESWQTWSGSLQSAQRTPSLPCCAFTITGLPNEEMHWFSVAAVNEVGEGPSAPPVSVAPPGWSGTIQGGTSSSDFAGSVSVGPSGDLYAVGTTYEGLDGESPLGGSDGYVVRYRTNGQRVWTRLIGTPADELIHAAAVDDAGNVYIAGATSGAFPLETAQGMGDVFLAKLNTSGDLVWLHQIGTGAADSVAGAAVLGTNAVCFAGTTSGDLDGENNVGLADAYVTLYDATGTRQWTRLVGTTSAEEGNAVAIGPSGKCYVGGATAGALQGSNLGGKDAFVAEYLPNGGQTFLRQFGSTADQRAVGVVVDEPRDRIYVSGDTLASFGGQILDGPSDPFVVAYDRSAGTIDWTRFVGGGSVENPAEVALLSDGRIVAAYYAFQFVTNEDIVVVQLDTGGTVSWTTAASTGSLDYFSALDTDDYGNSYVTGYTMGSMGAPNAGSWDYVVVKFGPAGDIR